MGTHAALLDKRLASKVASVPCLIWLLCCVWMGQGSTVSRLSDSAWLVCCAPLATKGVLLLLGLMHQQ
jgi:hypothetical protein